MNYHSGDVIPALLNVDDYPAFFTRWCTRLGPTFPVGCSPLMADQRL